MKKQTLPFEGPRRSEARRLLTVRMFLLLLGISMMILPGLAHAQSRVELSLTGSSLFSGSDYQGGGFSVTGHISSEFAIQGRFYSVRVKTFNQPFFTVKDGGSDSELRLLYHSIENPKLDAAVGVSEASTYARSSSYIGTFEVGWTEMGCGGKSLRFSVGGVGTGSALIMAGFNFSNPAGHNSALIAQLAYPLQGENGLSISTGNSIRGLVGKAGIALGVSPSSKAFGELVLTNSEGITTGTALSPMSNRRLGVQATIGVRL